MSGGAAGRRPLELGEAGGDRIEERPARGVRWNLLLVWFMRLAAMAWIAKGLAAWAVILDAMGLPVPFEARSTGFQAIAVYFAVIDLVAAVGLWLTSTWGGVLWLLAVMSHLILAFFFPAAVIGGWPVMAALSAAVAAYLVLSWLAAGEAE